ncbi:hypothetical protein RJ641_021874 [Dillenia turbinata]|uniref:FAR1 domain-containing protein n=1 Tax=Dillenia turbinata TaxID=194707 RepID=A0AAN8YYW2_9MAGN
MILVKYEKSGKVAVTKFIKEHNHPLMISPCDVRQTMDEKDRKIQELSTELQNKKWLCEACQEQLIAFMKDVEEHNDQLTRKVQVIANNLQKFEHKDLQYSHNI